jgi:type IV pilus assembly protein PilW
LVEIMIALTLGLLLSLGIMTVFSAAGSSGKVQDALARLQENGRYATTRIAGDLRMLGAQYCDTASAQDASIAVASGTVVYPANALVSYSLGVGTATAGALFDGGGVVGSAPAGWVAGGSPYALSPAALARGYQCAFDGSCVPAAPEPSGLDGLPPAGTAVNTRVQGAAVLTIRYQSGTGWGYTATGSGGGTVLHLNVAYDASGTLLDDDPSSPLHSFDAGNRALVSTCAVGRIFSAANIGSANAPVLAPADPIDRNFRVANPASGRLTTFDSRVFNFSKDFVTVTYYLLYKADPSTPGRLLPTLMRKLNGTDYGDEIVQGVERLDFLYGVQYRDGSLHYLTAAEVDAESNAANCLLPAASTMDLSGCLWGSLRSVEVHMLLDSVGNLPLGDDEMAFRYSIDGNTPTAPPCQPPSSQTASMSYCTAGGAAANGSITGRMLRREFISTINVRNGNR